MDIVKVIEAGGIIGSGAVLASELIKPHLSVVEIGLALAVFAYCAIDGTRDHWASQTMEIHNIGGDDYDGPNSD